MDKERFLDEVNRQLRIIFNAIREGHKPPEVLKHRCEGFMRAGVFLGVVKNPELSTLMEDLHLDVVGMTIDERMARHRDRYKDEEINYSQYESPSYERIKV